MILHYAAEYNCHDNSKEAAILIRSSDANVSQVMNDCWKHTTFHDLIRAAKESSTDGSAGFFLALAAYKASSLSPNYTGFWQWQCI